MRRIRAIVPILTVALVAAGCVGEFPIIDGPIPADAGDSDPVAATLEIVVHIDPAITSIDAVNRASGTTTLDVMAADPNLYLVQAAVGVDTEVLADQIALLPGVLFAELNADVRPAEITAERIYRWSLSTPQAAGSQYADELLELDAAHAISRGGGVRVAVIDTGVQLTPGPHPELARVLDPGVDFIDNDATPDDIADGLDDDGNGEIDEGYGHGTHVAGIVHRTAPNARIVPLRVLDSDGGGDEWRAAKAMAWAETNDIDVVNLSAGRHGSAALLVHMVGRLADHGVVTVVASGNDGRGRTTKPAVAKCALAVLSSGPTDAVSTFSTTGNYLDVGAPGEAIVSSFPGSRYASWDGTSMAAPFVAGEAALLRARVPNASVGAIMTVIKGTTVPFVPPATDAGTGRVSPLRALRALSGAASVTPNPVSGSCF